MNKHPSRPYNPDIANALFRSGYVESWGRGMLKMKQECAAAGKPEPLYYYEMSGFWVEFKKDIYYEEYLKELGLNERQAKAIFFAKANGKVTNKDYQEMNTTSRETASRDLRILVEKKCLVASGQKGAGAFYILK